MADKVGAVVFDAKIDTQGIRRDAKKIEGDLDSVGNKGGDTFGKLGTYAKAGMIAAAAAVAAGTVKMLGSMAELEQQVGGSEAVFGQFAKTIQKDATNAYRVAGLSQSEFLQGANKMGSLFQGAGFDVKTSMELSSKAMTRASDVASIMGIDTKFALESIAGAAKGNFTMMDNLGVAMNDTTLNAYAMEKGIGKSTQQMTNQEKVGLAMQMFLEKTAKYAGNYAKENDTLAGSLNTTKKAFDDWLAGAGSITIVLDNAIRTLGIAGDTISTRFPALQPIIDGVRQGFTAVGQALGWMWQQFQPIFETISANKPLLEFLGTFFKALAVIVGGALVAAFGLVLGAVTLVIGIFEALRNVGLFLGDVIYNVATFFVNAWKTIVSTWNVATGWFNGIVGGIRGAFSSIPAIIGGAFTSAWNTVTGLWSGIGRWFSGLGGQMVGAGKSIIDGLVNGISSAKDAVVNKVKEIASGALDAVKKFFGIKSPSKVMAQMGTYMMQGWSIGMDKSSSMAISSAQRASSGVLGTFDNLTSPTLGIDGSGSLSGSYGSRTANITNNYVVNNQADAEIISRKQAYAMGAV